MVDNARESSQVKNQNAWIRKASLVLGLILVAIGPVILFIYNDTQAGWAMMFSGLIFMAVSRFEDVEEIALASFKMKLFERRVGNVEASVHDLQNLAKQSSRLALASIQFSGRFDGFDDAFKEQALTDTRKLLNDLGVDDADITDIESLWHDTVEFDYSLWATGQSQVPKDLPLDRNAEWNNLRNRGIKGRSSPDDIRSFFVDAAMLTPEREEILKDYEYYIKTRQHRRPEAWTQRHE